MANLHLVSLESLIIVLSVVTFGVQVIAWNWVRKLSHHIAGEGYALIRLVSFLMGWMVLLRVVGFVGLATVPFTRTTDFVLAITVVTQVLFLIVIFIVWRRLRYLA